MMPAHRSFCRHSGTPTLQAGLPAALALAAVLSLAGCPAVTSNILPSDDPGGSAQLAGTWAVAPSEGSATFALLTFDEVGRLRQMCYEQDITDYGASSIRFDGQPRLVAGGVSLAAQARVAESADQSQVVVTIGWIAWSGLTATARALATTGIALTDANSAEGFLSIDYTRSGETSAVIDPIIALRLSDNTDDCLADDAFEDNDTPDAAAEIAPGSYDGLRCFDDDWYKLVVPAGKVATAMVVWDDRFGSVDFHGYAENGVDAATAPFQGPGTYLVKVEQIPGMIQPDYTLIIQTFSEDPYEENDTLETAAPITPGSYDLTVVDDDWFRIDGDTPAVIRASIAFNNALGDLDLELYDEHGEVLATSGTVADTETVAGYSLTGKFLIHVLGYSGQSNACRLTVDVTPIVEDQWEENDSLETAAPIKPGTYEVSVLDDDWFRVSVGKSASLQVTLDFDNDQGDLDLELYEAQGGLLAISTSVGNTEICSGYAASGEFLIHVYSVTGINRCTMTVRATPITEDAFEENDTPDTAALVTPGTYPITVIDADWFRVEAAPGAELKATLTFDNDLGDVDLQLQDGAGHTLDVSATLSDKEQVSGTSPSGVFLIHVYPYGGANTCTLKIALE